MPWKSVSSCVENASSLGGYSASITWTDVTSTSYAISSGEYSGTLDDYAFDDSNLTYWASSQTGTGIKNVAYIGQNFGTGNSKTINAIRLTEYLLGETYEWVSNVEFQGSNDGSSWTPITYIVGIVSAQTYTFYNTTAYQYYRLLARSNLTSTHYWMVGDFEMFELSVTNKVPVTDSDGYLLNAAIDMSVSDLSDTPSSFSSDDDGKVLRVSSTGTVDLSDVTVLNSRYVKTPEGLVLQWGTVSRTTAGTETIYFPTTFPTACYQVLVCGKITATTSSSDWCAQAVSWGTSSFVWQMQYDDSSTNANGGYYIAIGR